jgi:SAM-dependent methyltransferase
MIQEDLLALVPPVSELKRVGPIFDVETYLKMGRHSIGNLQKFAYLRPEHSVLDVGCGFGRVAIQLTKYLKPEARYFGIDVVAEEIDWCKANISTKHPNFRFHHIDAHNKRYNPTGQQRPVDVNIPISRGEQFDLAFLFSVFTHMLPADVQHYLTEINKHLKPGGIIFATFFLINRDSLRYMEAGKSQFRFVKEEGGYYAANRTVHEAAVAYDEDSVHAMFGAAGFARDKVVYGNWAGRHPAESGQDLVVCTRSQLTPHRERPATASIDHSRR